MRDDNSVQRQVWENEILAGHRWGQHGAKASQECTRLRKLWDRIEPLDDNAKKILDQIIALEICNWNLEESILVLCEAIGLKQPTRLVIGHHGSVCEERWHKVWAYYLALRNWLRRGQTSGYTAMLVKCDPDKDIQKHVESLLGDRNELKELYVERFCLCLEIFLDGTFADESARPKAHGCAVSVLEAQISKLDPESDFLKAMDYGTGGARLFPCNHKVFRRYDIILSSIGIGKWRGAMPMKGTDGFERADLLEKYLSPIQSWIDSHEKPNKLTGNTLSDKICNFLGEHDPTKLFFSSLLVSLLRSQQEAARLRVGSRLTGPSSSGKGTKI